MSSHDEVRRLRHDLDEVMKRAAEISQRLGELETRQEPPAASVEPPEISKPLEPVASVEPPEIPKPLEPVAPARVEKEEISARDEAAPQEQETTDPAHKNETLRRAVRKGDVALAKHCIEAGADVNAVIDCESPLDLAVEAGQFVMVQFLVANGARIEHGSIFAFAKSQIRQAQALGYDEIADFLEQQLFGAPQSTSTESTAPPPDMTPVSDLSEALDPWRALIAGPLGGYVRERVEKIRTRTREVGWEVQLGTYMLPRVAILCIAIAVVFFLTLAIERWGAAWMPHLRVGIGYAVSVGLLVLAWRSETKYVGLARVLYGGGFAVMYFVTFATHYVGFARVFASPAPTLILLTVIVVAWAIAAQIRQSKVVAVLVTALGHLTILISTLTLDSPGPFSMMGLVALSAGSAFFLLRNRWYYVASLGLVGSYANVLVALARGHGVDPYADFAGSMGVLAVFFLIFALAELFSPEELRRKTVPGWFRNAFVTLNTVCFLALGTVVMNSFDFTRGHQDLFRFCSSAVLLMIALGYLRLRAGDPLFNVYFLKSIALFTLALATRYGGNSLSLCLAIEMVAILVSARRSGLLVMRLMAFAVGGIAFVQTLGAVFQIAFGSPVAPGALHLTTMAYAAPGYVGYVIRAVLGVAAFLLASQLYQRTDWTLRSPRSAPFSPGLLSLCWQLDLVTERPDSFENTEKPYEGLFFPYLYSLAGTILFLAYAFPLVQGGHRFGVMAGFALALTVGAALLHSKPFGLTGIALFVLAALPIGCHELALREVINLPVAIAGLAAAAMVALASEERHIGRRVGLEFHQQIASPYILYGACALLMGLLLVAEIPGVNGAFALAAAAVLAAGLFLTLHATALAAVSGGFMLWASVVFVPEVFHYFHDAPAKFGAAIVALTLLSLLADRYFSHFEKRTAIAPYLCAGFVVNAMAVLLCHFEACIRPEWLMTATALACYGFLAYGAAFGSRAAFVLAFAGTFYASLRNAGIGFDATVVDTGLGIATVLLVILSLLGDRYLAYFKKHTEIAPYVGAALVVNAMAVLLCYFEVRIQPEWLMTATALVCYGFLAYGAAFGSPAALVLAFAGTFYASLRNVGIGFDATVVDTGLGVATVLLVILSLLGDRYLAYFKKRTEIAPYVGAALVVNAMAVLLCYFEVRIQPEWLMTATALVCYGFLAYGVTLRIPSAAAVSAAGILYASIRHTAEAFGAESLQPGFIIAFVLLAVFWILSERLYVRWAPRLEEFLAAVARNVKYDPRRPESAMAPIGLAAVLLLVLLERIPYLMDANLAFVTIGWFALAAALFILSLLFHQRFYRYAGLVVILLSLGRLFLLDMKEQDPLLRVAAFAVVGAGLLCISIGYYKWMARVHPAERNKADKATPENSQDTKSQ